MEKGDPSSPNLIYYGVPVRVADLVGHTGFAAGRLIV